MKKDFFFLSSPPPTTLRFAYKGLFFPRMRSHSSSSGAIDASNQAADPPDQPNPAYNQSCSQEEEKRGCQGEREKRRGRGKQKKGSIRAYDCPTFFFRRSKKVGGAFCIFKKKIKYAKVKCRGKSLVVITAHGKVVQVLFFSVFN